MARRRRRQHRSGFRPWWIFAGLGALVLFAVALAAGAYLWLRTSLPVVDGTVAVAGLNARVEVIRDKHAIPHIFATTDHDAFYALGFVHAQDRRWQMEFQRRLAAGRLSEIIGERTLSIDKFIRTMGIPQAVAATAARLSPEARAAYEAYADGVNAGVAGSGGAPPLEFVLLGVDPEPWRVEDSIGWAKMMAWDLGGNAWDEALRARLAKTLTSAEIDMLWPNHPKGHPAVPAEEVTETSDDFGALAQVFPPRPPDGQGSNNWVLSGAHTTSGKPLLANDPHLGLTTPSLWYLAHLSAPGLEVIGATLPGVPAPVLGRNQHIAWGFTNTNPDVQDLFIETIDQNDPTRYVTPNGSEPFVERNEIIRVKDKPDETLFVRETRHGPVVSDLVEHSDTFLSKGRVIAFSWTALSPNDLTPQAGLGLIKASNWEGFVTALEDFGAPVQNMVYADVEGNIGYIAPGYVPIRSSGEGWMPSDGASGEGEWTGAIPFYAMPREFNPSSGRIVTANNRVVGPDYPYFVSHDWSPNFRYDRTNELLDATATHDVASFATIQQDFTSLGAKKILPLLLATVKSEDAAVNAALERLKSFDGAMAADRAEPLIYVAWLRELMRGLFADELEGSFADYWSIRLAPIETALTTQQSFCDDRTTAVKEDCGRILGATLERGLVDLRQRYGDDMGAWRWGEAHAIQARHRVLGEVPGIGGLFEIAMPHGGDRDTVNAGGFTVSDELNPFGQNHGAGYRAIYDLANPDRSVFIQSSGQSGNPFSPYYKSFATLWQAGAYVPMITERAAIEADKLGTLVLTPP